MAALNASDRASVVRVIQLLQALLAPEPAPEETVAGPIAWGARVSPTFRERVRWIANTLHFNASWLMACIAWETGRTFSASIKNAAGSGATGLIQFMPRTAEKIGTTVQKLARMTAEDQLNYVYKYLRPWADKIYNVDDLYMTILWPKGVGKPADYVIFDGRAGGIAYRQNAGFDTNADKAVTKSEASAKLRAILAEGLRPENVA